VIGPDGVLVYAARTHDPDAVVAAIEAALSK